MGQVIGCHSRASLLGNELQSVRSSVLNRVLVGFGRTRAPWRRDAIHPSATTTIGMPLTLAAESRDDSTPIRFGRSPASGSFENIGVSTVDTDGRQGRKRQDGSVSDDGAATVVQRGRK
jgi:hypothetical protein